MVFENKLDAFIALRGFSDGGVQNQSRWNTDGKAASGWFLQGGKLDGEGNLVWLNFLEGYVYLGAGIASFEAELIGVLCLVESLFYVFSLDSKCSKTQTYYRQYIRPYSTKAL